MNFFCHALNRKFWLGLKMLIDFLKIICGLVRIEWSSCGVIKYYFHIHCSWSHFTKNCILERSCHILVPFHCYHHRYVHCVFNGISDCIGNNYTDKDFTGVGGLNRSITGNRERIFLCGTFFGKFWFELLYDWNIHALTSHLIRCLI